jgi:diacylglycerol kinase (ATP)
METKHSLIKSFKFAFEGISAAFRKGRNFRIQSFSGVIAIILGVLLKISASEWLDLFLIISLVLILELVNTAVEEIVDLVSPQIQEKAKIAKDVSAAAVLVASVGAVCIGFAIFFPKLLLFY